MRLKCGNPQCGGEFEVPEGEALPSFCTYCGQKGLSVQEERPGPAEGIAGGGPAAVRALQPSGALVGVADGPGTSTLTSSAQSTPAVLTGILTGRKPVGPPAPEPEDIPLLSVPRAPAGLIADDAVPLSSGLTAQQLGSTPALEQAEAAIPSPTSPASLGASEEESLSLLPALPGARGGAGATELGPEPAPVAETGEEEMATVADAGRPAEGGVDIDSLFRMLEVQLPENIERDPGTAGPASEVAFVDEEPALDQDEIPVPETAEPAHGSVSQEKQEADGALASAPLVMEAPRKPAASAAPRANVLPSSSHLLGAVGGPIPEASQPFSAWILDAARYPIGGRGAPVLAVVSLVWIVALLLIGRGLAFAAVPLLLALAVLCLGSALAAALLGSAGSQGALRWPLTTDFDAWKALMGGLGRFALLAVPLAIGTALANSFARGFAILLPVFLLTGGLIVCFDPFWKAVFRPRRHLALLARAPLPMLRAVALSLLVSVLLPVMIGKFALWALGGSGMLSLLAPVLLFTLAGPFAWYGCCVAGCAMGSTYAAHRALLMSGRPPAAHENVVGLGMLIFAILVSVLGWL